MNTKKSVWNFQIVAAMVNGSRLIDIYFGWTWEYLATRRLCIYEPYFRTAFKTVSERNCKIKEFIKLLQSNSADV